MLLFSIAEAGTEGLAPAFTGDLPDRSLQRGTCVRSNNNKKKIEQSDFPAEAPEGNSDEHEAGYAEHSVQDLSPECSKESCLIKISESCDHTKNEGGTNEGEEHRAHEVFVVPEERQQALCPEGEILSYSCKYLFCADLQCDTMIKLP